MLTWTLMDVIFHKQPSLIGSVNGMITGLVAITPAAGVISGWAAIVFGACSGSIPWISMNVLGKRTKLFTRHVDDCLGITHTHMVAGALGGFLVGLFAEPEGTAAFGLTNNGGAIAGNGKQVWLQIVGALFIIGWNVVWTSLILLFIKYVCRVPLRMTEDELLIGDEAIHGESAYCLHDDIEGLEVNQDQRRTKEGKDIAILEGQDVGGNSSDRASDNGFPSRGVQDGGEIKRE